MTTELYQASPIRRTRATKAEVGERREALFEIIEDGTGDAYPFPHV